MRFFAGVLGAMLLISPSIAFAFPFGGQASQVIKCYNQVIYAALGAPRGGPYVWTGATKTYQNGPPAYAGQWLLGLASAPYYCIVTLSPLVIVSGTAISMMGSSGAAAPAYNPPASTNAFSNSSSGSSSSGGASGSYTTSTIGHVVVNEVFYNVDAAHGTKPQNEWVELYNPTNSTVDLSSWKLVDDAATSTLPAGTKLAAGAYLIVTDATTTAQRWNLTATAQVITLGSPVGNGLATAGDVVRLKNSSGATIDAVSWGTNSKAFSPSVPASPAGYSLLRKTLASDSDTAADWTNTSAPTPAR